MQRNTGPQNRLPVVTAPENLPKQTSPSSRTTGHDHVGTFWDMLGIRIVFMAVCIAAGFHFTVQRDARIGGGDRIFVRVSGHII